jgi:hypothetical protein
MIRLLTQGYNLLQDTVPLIRLGEMYCIAAECNIEKNPSETIRLLSELKLHRGYLTADRGISSTANAASLLGLR